MESYSVKIGLSETQEKFIRKVLDDFKNETWQYRYNLRKDQIDILNRILFDQRYTGTDKILLNKIGERYIKINELRKTHNW